MTSSHESAQGAVETAQLLTAAVSGLREDLDAKFAFLSGYTHKTRRIVIMTIISLILDFTLTGLFLRGEIQIRANEAVLSAQAATVSELSAVNIRGCQSGNLIRQREFLVWEHIITVSKPPASETAAERAQRLRKLAAFQRFLRSAYAPRNCVSIYRQAR